METSSLSTRNLIQQAHRIIDQYTLSHIENLGVTEILQELEEVDAKIAETRTNRFKDVEESQFAALTNVVGKLDTYCVIRLNSNASGIPELRECYKAIQKQYRVDLEAIREIFSSRVTEGISTSDGTVTHWRKLVDAQIDTTKSPSRTLPGKQGVNSPEYEKAFENLTTHLSNIANPIVLQDLVTSFQEIAKRSVNGRAGISANFSKLSLPKETRGLIDQFDKQLKLVCRIDSASKLESILIAVGEHLSMLSKFEIPDTKLWPELLYLLSLDEVKMLENNLIKEILHLAKAGRTDALRSYTQEKLAQNGVELEALDDKLEDLGKFDLNTVIGQAIEKRPLETNGIITHWEKPPEFFERKTLIFGSTLHFGNPSGQIIECWPGDSNSLWFRLDTDFRIQIMRRPPDCLITVKKELTYRLLRLINRVDTEPFQLVRSPDSPQDKGIPSGIYKLSHDELWYYAPVHGIAMLTNQNTQKQYIISRHLSGSHSESYIVSVVRKKRGVAHNIETLNKDEFLKTYLAKRESIAEPFLVSKEKCEKLIVIKKETNEARLKITQRKAIDRLINKVRSFLLESRNQTLLSSLTDCLVINRLEKIDVDLMTLPPPITSGLEEASEAFKQHFKINNSPHDLLRKVVLEAIYAQLEIKVGSIVIANTLDLLQQAQTHTDKLQGKHGVVVMGETGVGKSASIAYWAGAKMQQSKNQVGDKVIALSPRNPNLSIYPSIGQALGTSETLYAQGYEAIDPRVGAENIVLVDCPGFSDTRGTEWELCANLSVDEAVSKLRDIRSLVVVAPFSAFQDKANAILDLIITVQDRFSGTFLPGRPELSSLYLVITKAPETGPEARMQLSDRISKHIQEVETQLSVNAAEQNQGIESEKNKKCSLENKKAIWQSLQEMYTNNQIHFIDLLDRENRASFVKDLCKRASKGLKSTYVPALNTDPMRKEFGDIIELSTETWVQIFEQYRERVPQNIAQTIASMEEKNTSLKQLSVEKDQRAEKIQQYAKQIEALEAFVEELRKARDNPTQMTQKIYELMAVQEKDNLQQELDRLENELMQLKAKTLSKSNQLSKARDAVFASTLKIDNILKESSLLRAEVATMSTGDHEFTLENLSFQPHEMINLITLTDNKVSELAFQEVRNYHEREIKEREKKSVDDLDGPIDAHIIIEKKFRLVPSDPKMLAEFNKAYKASGADGTYEAKVEGEHFRNLRFKSAASGKKLAYKFETVWKRGGPLPWMKITYRIPNKEFHSATITNKSTQIERLATELTTTRKELGFVELKTGQQGELAELESEIEKFSQQSTRIQDQMNAITEKIHRESGRISTRIEKLLLDEEIRLGALRELKYALELSREIENKIEKTTQELTQLQEALEDHIRVKRNLAVTIKTKWDTICLLQKFARIALSDTHKVTVERGEGILTECTKFMRAFDTYGTHLLNECARDLKL